MKLIGYAFLITLLACSAEAFGNALFQEISTAQQNFASKNAGVEIELPDFDELFGRVQQVSPLARVAIEGNDLGGAKGFAAIDKSCK
jgi:hypothetical protein